jgi:hypothetical protein
MPRLDAAGRDEAVRRYLVGESSVAIGNALGVSSGAIRTWLHRRGVEIRSPKRPRKTPIPDIPTLTNSEYAVERWRPVPGWGDIYEVSDLGRIRSLDRVVIRRDGIRRPYKGRILTPGRDTDGYCSVGLYRGGQCIRRAVHTLVLTAFLGPPPPGMEACHGPGGRADNRLVNLRWDTHRENIWDSIIAGTHPCSKAWPSTAAVLRSWLAMQHHRRTA